MRKFNLYLFAIASVILFSCAENDLNPSLSKSKIYNDSIRSFDELQGLAYGMYDLMTTSAYYGRNYFVYNEIRSDNCFANGNSGRFLTVSTMNVSPDDIYPTDTWTAIYKVIATANVIIQQNPETIDGNLDQAKHIIGQAYVLRAWAHFDLLKLYGQQHAGGNLGIPYITEYIPIYTGEQIAPFRATVEQNRDSIYKDIEAGLNLMSDNLNDLTKQYITTFTGHAIMARVATYFEDWEIAKIAAGEVVSSQQFRIAETEEFINTWFTDAAANSIIELAFSEEDNLDWNSLSFIYRGSMYGDIEVLDDLISVFDVDDIRADSKMIGYETIRNQKKLRNLGKYPSADFSDNISLFRYEEVILILAEAKLELGESDALSVLNLIPAKRNAQLYTEATKENVLLERRKELCFEGFRFDDLARTGQDIPLVDPIKQLHGGPEYGSFKYAFPIPTAELNANPNMVKNEGY